MVKCNRGCGATNLQWRVVHDKFKLFNNNDLLHICNDGIQASKLAQEKATTAILDELGIADSTLIPTQPKHKDLDTHDETVNGDASKMFTINSTASGISISGDDRHNAIYIPKVAVSELVKALIDFIQ